MLRFSFIVLGLVPLVSLAAAGQTQAPQAVVGSNQTEGTNQQEIVLPIFAFHSGFWVNLHHFLYEQARRRDRLPLAAAAQPPEAPLPASVQLAPAEEQQWNRAVSYYAAQLAGQDLEFNGDMVLINNRLAELESCPEIEGSSAPRCASGLRPGLMAALEEAAPIYRAHWWPAQDRANRAWIAAVGQLVQQHGAALSQALVGVYQASWPTNPIGVDVVAYAGPWGAYASLNPPHVMIASSDLRNQGIAALAVLFNEASQVFAPDVAETLAREFHDQNKLVRRDLWQALLFYTSARMVERVLETAPGTKQPLPDKRWVREGLEARGWQAYAPMLEYAWQPYLDREIDFPTAIHLLVSQL
jgi:hypothetical protein